MSFILLHSLGETYDYQELRAAIAWAQRSVKVFGQVHPQPRLTRWYGAVPYQYSGLSWEPEPMPAIVDRLRQRVELLAKASFNSALCNLYRDGSDCVGYHADDEPVFGGDPIVASVSFGAARLFKLRRNDGSDKQQFVLGDGTLFIMGRGVQKEWKHSIPKSKKPTGERINLTFRQTV